MKLFAWVWQRLSIYGGTVGFSSSHATRRSIVEPDAWSLACRARASVETRESLHPLSAEP